MSKKLKIAAQNIEAVLEALADANCPNGCKCIFCRTFEAGRQSGFEDAAINIQRALDEFTRRAA